MMATKGFVVHSGGGVGMCWFVSRQAQVPLEFTQVSPEVR